MKRRTTVLITLCLLLGAGLISGYLIPRNTPIVAHFLNMNSIDIKVGNDLHKKNLKVELSIWGTEFVDVLIIENNAEHTIPKGYGENDWYLSYDNRSFGVFRHFKTNNWHDHKYSLNFYREGGEIKCDIAIYGPDDMKRTIVLDKLIKTDVGVESGRRYEREG